MTPQPEDTAAAARRRQRLWGVALGMFVYVVLLVVDVVVNRPGSRDETYPGLAFAVLSIYVTPVLLFGAGLLTISPRLRPLAIGLLIGVGLGVLVLGGVCVAIVAST